VPGAIRIHSELRRQFRQERYTSLRRVEIARECEDGRIIERGIAVRIAAGRVDEERAADGRVPLVARQRDVRGGAIRRDDELDVVSRPGTRLRSNRA
jgi:hypothetical protein